MASIDEDLRRLAADLYTAEQHSATIEPLSARHPGLGVAEAYEVQLEGVRLRIAHGDQVRGHKVGLTARVMQQQFTVTQPDFGHLLASMFHPEGAPLPVDALIAPRVEPEVAFMLARPSRAPV
jgi:2-keto-4-pentenoate hydratase